MNRSNIRFGIVALLVLFVVGWSRADDPIRVTDDQSFVTLRGGQYVSNFGEVWNRTKPLRIHGMPDAAGKKPKVGLVWHRPQHPRPGDGTKVNTSLHGCLLQSITFTGQFDISAFYNSGVEEGTYINVVVDAQCGVAKAVFSTADAWGLGFPHGPTLSGGNIVSMRLYGSGGVGFLAVGEVTDLYAGQISTSGTGAARIQVHTVAPYQWPTWGGGTATSQGMPKRIAINDVRMAEGVYETGIIYSKQATNLVQPPTVAVTMGGPFPYQSKVAQLGSIGAGGGPTDPPPTTQPTAGLVPVPTWGLGVPTNGHPNKTVSGVSFPSTANAGDIIEVSGGPYVGSIGYIPFTAQGTRERPIIIRGPPNGQKPRFNQKLYISGSQYVIVEGIDAHKIELGPGTAYVAIRNCRVGDDGTRKGGGIAVGGSGSSPSRDIVIAGCTITECGDWLAEFDQDIHGIAVGGNVSNLWVTGCKISHVSGDAIQINAGSLANQPTLHHVYVYNNEMWECKQTGGATKQAKHVVFAGNYVHHMRPIGASPSAWGAGFGHQYGAGPIWFIANRIENCCFGIGSGSTSGQGDGQYAYYIFNRFDNIRHDANYPFNSGTSWSNAALSLVGNPNKYAIGNDIRNADGGIYFPGGTRILCEGNILNNVLNQDIWLEDPNGNQSFNVLSNLAWPTAELRRANQPLPWPIGNVIADPATAGRTWIPSPEAVAIFDKYQAEFGVDLRAANGPVPWAVGAPK